MKIKPQVSIIIPVYNGEKTIKRAVESCLNQDFTSLEILVIDNASTDATREIVSQIKCDQIHYYYFEEKGRSFARNKGIELSKGDFIQFLDADDTLSLSKISHDMALFANNPTIDAVADAIEYRSVEGELLKTIQPKFHFENELLAHNVFPINAILLKKMTDKQFPEELSYCEDWYYWVETLYGKNIFFDSAFIGGTVHIHGENTMADTSKMSEYELFVQQKIKNKWKKFDIQLLKNECTLMVIHYFNADKSELTIEAIQKSSKKLYFFIQCICRVPGIKQVLKGKVEALRTKNIY